MVKLIIFDMDGVLVEAKQIHFDTLNQALREISEEYVISEAEHLSIYDGLKTTQKLELLTKNKGLHPNTYETIWNRKQNLTIDQIIYPSLIKISCFSCWNFVLIMLACVERLQDTQIWYFWNGVFAAVFHAQDVVKNAKNLC